MSRLAGPNSGMRFSYDTEITTWLPSLVTSRSAGVTSDVWSISAYLA